MAVNFQLPYEALGLDVDAFDKFIKDQGVPLDHYKAVACPIGMIDSLDVRSPHHEHANCSNGYIYKFAGTVTATFTNNSAITSLGEVGLIDGSVVNVTFPRFYDNCTDKHVYIQLYDRFYVKDCAVLVPNTQKIEAHITGIDKLTYMAEKVEYVIDAHNKEYSNSDFNIVNGRIEWSGDNRPGFNPDINKGVIYSIRYLYTPFFYASRLIHEVRIINRSDFKTGSRTHFRAPYAALLSREYYMYKEERSENLEDSRRDLPSPRDSVFGPR